MKIGIFSLSGKNKVRMPGRYQAVVLFFFLLIFPQWGYAIENRLLAIPVTAKQQEASKTKTAATASPLADKGLAIAIRGPLPPAALEKEQILYDYLGQMPGLHAILTASTPEDFFKVLARYSNSKNGKAVNYLVIQGHGNADNPGISLSQGTALTRSDIDYGFFLERMRFHFDRRQQAKKSLAQLERNSDDLEREAKRAEMFDRIADANHGIGEFTQLLDQLESVSQALQPGARVLLLNCSAYAKKAGQDFVHQLATVLLGRRGGQLAASTTDLAVLQTGGDWIFDGMFRWIWTFFRYGRIATPGNIEVAGTGWFGDRLNWAIVDRKAEPKLVFNSKLPVEFDPFIVKTVGGRSLQFTPKVRAYPDSGTLRYSWLWPGGAATGATATIQLPQDANGLFEVTVLVTDERGRDGSDSLYLVAQPKCRYSLSDWGDCDPGTGRQQRSILLKEPPACQESIPPALERKCTPKINPTAESSTARRFSGSIPANWQGACVDKGFHLTRNHITGGGKPKDCSSEAVIDAEIHGVLNPSFAPATAGEARNKLEGELADMKRYLSFSGADLQGYQILPLTGYLLTTSPQFKGGVGNPMSGYQDLLLTASGHGYLVDGQQAVEVRYSVTSGGCWNQLQRSWQEGEAQRAIAEVKGILASLRYGVDSGFAVDPAMAIRTPSEGAPQPTGKMTAAEKQSTTPMEPQAEKLLASQTVSVVKDEGAKGIRDRKNFSFLGSWTVVANGFQATLELRAKEHSVQGTIYFESKPEVLTDIVVEGGQIEFTRPIPHFIQRFKGTFKQENGKVLVEGTFDQQGTTDIYTWSGHLDKSAAKVADVTPSAVPAFNPSELVGEYAMNANGFTGRLSITSSNGQLSALLNLGRDETMEKVKFDGTILTFTRPIPNLDQIYRGNVSGQAPKWHVEGEFTQQGGGVFPWHADRQ